VSKITIIVSAGEGKRWGNYLDVEKSHVTIENREPIIKRTMRQVKFHKSTLHVVSNLPTVMGVTTKKPHNNPNWSEANKMFSSMPYWSQHSRTTILFGDTYFTDEAMAKIMKHDKSGFYVFGRPFGSNITGKSYGEIYAISFSSEDKEQLLFALQRVSKLEERGVIEKANVWAVYRAMLKLPDDLMNEHIVGSRFVNIDDWTEDFDYPHDYDNFMHNWKKFHASSGEGK
jgi:hypothetical protein